MQRQSHSPTTVDSTSRFAIGVADEPLPPDPARPVRARPRDARTGWLSACSSCCRAARRPRPGPLATTVAGLAFPNPLGMAAGFDKDGEVPDALLGLGFGFAEVGSITPLPQAGNPKPRLFRLDPGPRGDQPDGVQQPRRRSSGAAARGAQGSVAGWSASISARTRIRPTGLPDYAVMARVMAPLATYLAVNVSSPNTPGLAGVAGRRRAGRTARRGEGRGERSDQRQAAADFPQGRARSRARRYRCDCPHRDRQAARRADRLQHHHLPPPVDSARQRARPAASPARRCATLPSNGCAISARPPAGRSRWSAWAASPPPRMPGRGSGPGRASSSFIRQWSMKGPGSRGAWCAGSKR